MSWPEKLYHLSLKPERKIIGLMSGTSLDGLDIAYCSIKNTGLDTQAEVLAFDSIPYSTSLKKSLEEHAYRAESPLSKITQLNMDLGRLYGKYINRFLRKNNIKKDDVDLIASHGQTVYHYPSKNKRIHHSTLQIADGDHIATKTGIPTISDFRQKHLATGGEGAPLSCYGDYLLYSDPNKARVFLNIGGISNFTYLDGSMKWENMLSGDLGPGNTLMDRFVRIHYSDLDYDKDGLISARGIVCDDSLERLLEHHFFDLDFPKSTGQELFNERYVLERISTSLDGDDLIATLAAFTTQAISLGFKQLNLEDTEVYISGGGRYNPTLIKLLEDANPDLCFKDIEDLGVRADAKEALLFAVLANESYFGKGLYLPEQQKYVRLGKLSLPD